MREVYIPNKQTYNDYKRILQKGGGYDEMGYIYNIQKGAGLGSFFKNLLKIALPVSKKILSKGVTLAKPHLQRIAQEGISAATDIGINSIRKYSNKAQQKVGSSSRKRKQKPVYTITKKSKIDKLS